MRRSVVLAALALPGLASAGNGAAPPVLPEFPDAPCLELVDLSSTGELHLPYSLLEEDLELTDDEVEDSRTHQFIAFDEQAMSYPRWVSWDDVDAAVEKGLLEAEGIHDEDVLETSESHAGHWRRITADDARRPISFETADEGVTWDVSELDPGAWIVGVYAHKPPASSWTRQPTVFVMVAGPEAEPAPAAWVLGTGDLVLDPGEATNARACVSSSVTRVRFEMAPWGYDEEAEWTTYAIVDAPPSEQPFAVQLQAPCEPGQHRLRVVAEDDSGERYVALSHTSLGVLEADVQCTPPEVDEPPLDDGETASSGCRVTQVPSPLGWGFVAMALGVALRAPRPRCRCASASSRRRECARR